MMTNGVFTGGFEVAPVLFFGLAVVTFGASPRPWPGYFFGQARISSVSYRGG